MGFSEIYGHDKQINILKKAFSNNRLARSFLFTGISGVGKKLVAISLAKALNCERENLDFCNNCPACKKIEHGNHPEFTVITPQNNLITIDTIRTIKEQLKFKTIFARMRVFIIDDCHKMNTQAANALLKTLEETPEKTLFILITSSPHRLLPTIISRCQRITFSPIYYKEIEKLVKEKFGFDGKDSSILSLMAIGSLGRVKELLNKKFWDMRQSILKRLVGISKGLPDKALSIAFDLGKNREELLNLLEVIIIFYRDMLIYKYFKNTEKLINKDMIEEIKGAAKKNSSGAVFNQIEEVKKARTAIINNANIQLTMEMMLLRIQHIEG
ncbi:MAG: DNA polymerase III subunit delta' [Thermodesulfobacteriota bacterium]|nr:DNA polymerase III subunit delta' [Thermodesulfobacteriota bacterium]